MVTNRLENSVLSPCSTAARLLLRLKTRGPQNTADLGTALGLSGEAARKQLTKLAAAGLGSV